MDSVTAVIGGGSVLAAYTVIVGWFFKLLTNERRENRRLEKENLKAAARVEAEREARHKLQDDHNRKMSELYAEVAELRKQVADYDIELRRLRAKIEDSR